jgi:hypothetical protein
LSSGVTEIFSSGGAFAALKSDGSVFTWNNYGDQAINWGGNSSSVSSDLSSGVVEIFSTFRSFAALKSDGSVVAWGDPVYGGTNAAESMQGGWYISSSVCWGLTGVTKIYSSHFAFAAIVEID